MMILWLPYEGSLQTRFVDAFRMEDTKENNATWFVSDDV
jgi:hypothetical protein